VPVIEYTVESEDGGQASETFTLVTDIPDPGILAMEQAAAYTCRRWQLKTCLDELETSVRGGATVVLCSKSSPMIRQESYAMLCCYQAIRTLISRARRRLGAGSPPSLLHRGPRRGPPAHQRPRARFPLRSLARLAGLAFEITLPRSLMPARPGRRYARDTKRVGGRHKTRKPSQPSQPSRLISLTEIRFWPLPVPT
jgi:hypothetical protein